MNPIRILISGGGIAGLTCAVELKRRGHEPLVIEREGGPRAEGYMMDFFGTGWDVAERMGLIENLRAIRYPIDVLEFVDARGRPYVRMPIERMRRALEGNYVYLRRADLEGILAERAREMGVEIRYGCSLSAIEDRGAGTCAQFEDGGEDEFAFIVGADGVHSRLRELVFGPERQFARFLGLYVAAFHVARGKLPIHRTIKLYEETDRLVFLYPLSEDRLDAAFLFRHEEMRVAASDRIGFLRERFRGAGWIVEDVLAAYAGDDPIFLDSVTQIAMPQWYKGQVALIGDACGCLTLLAGQGSHMAMAGAYVLAEKLAREPNHTAAFAAYQAALKAKVDRKQRDAARYAGLFVPSASSRPWLRRMALQLLFSAPILRIGLRAFGSKSVLAGYGR